MLEFLRQLKVVATSTYAFVAYIIVAIAWLVISLRVRRNKQLLKHLVEIPKDQRLEALRLEMDTVLPQNITPEQWLKHKDHQYYFLGFAIVCLLFLVTFAIAFQRTYDPPDKFKLTVHVGQTGHAFNEDIYLKLTQITPGDGPHDDKVSATVMSPGYPPKGVENEGVGSIIPYIGKDEYSIQIISIGETTATFLVSKK